MAEVHVIIRPQNLSTDFTNLCIKRGINTLNGYIITLDQLSINDIEKVGGKNASLGEMIGAT